MLIPKEIPSYHHFHFLKFKRPLLQKLDNLPVQTNTSLDEPYELHYSLLHGPSGCDRS
jgi:hypothetical protein